MEWDIRVETNGQQPYSSVDDLTNYEQSMPPYAYCLPRYTEMDGTYSNVPDVLEHGQNGYISTALGGQDGDFGVSPVIAVTFDRLKTSNGMPVMFDRTSGDYASRPKITWYKDTELVQEQEFTPDRVEYFCLAKVPLFNQLVITFLETNQPYRYLWLSVLRNQRMTDAGGLKIVHDDIALGAADDHTATTDNKDYYVDLRNLKVGIKLPDYTLRPPRYAKMDGGYSNAPDTLDDMGYVSGSISNADGRFTTPPALTFTFGRNHSSVRITLTFNDYSRDYCSEINIKWCRDDTLLANQNYYPDTYNYFCYGIVDHYNKVVITSLKTNESYWNIFLTGVTWGLIRIFKDGEVEDINCLMELNPISEEVSIDIMDCTIRSKSGYASESQKEQKQTLYFNKAILGIFYLKDDK